MDFKFMKFNRIFIYLAIFLQYQTVSFAITTTQTASREQIVQYITTISNTIYLSLPYINKDIIYSSNKELRIKLFLSPWGELKDAYVSRSSGNKELDSICLKAVLNNDRYEPFPNALGNAELWIEIPVIFESGDAVQAVKMPVKNSEINVNEAIDLALENHLAAKIAQKEIDFQRLKIREANRALYPAASVNYLETTGKTEGITQDFTDKEYKLKVEYPLYYGWRLRYAIMQASANLKASTANYDKVLQEMRGEVETAFYSYITNRINVKLHKDLLVDAEKIFDMSKKRFEAGLITNTEFLQSESQIKQINYQIISSENELAVSRLSLAQAMNVDEKDAALDMNIDKELEPIDLNISIEQCLDLAYRMRPDLRSKEYSLEANDYERKVNASKNGLRVDLTGTYGRSGGAYETESLNLKEDWYFGLKVTKPLGGNTVSTAYTEDQTSPKHGQTTLTSSASKSMELGLLDNIQYFSEVKQADISYDKAKDELQQVKDAIVKEVKEAYLNYKKALVQIKSNQNKIKYREEELKITKARAELNETALSDVVQGYMNLTDEKSFYAEAVGSLYQSLAKLNKATGYALFLDDESFKLAKQE